MKAYFISGLAADNGVFSKIRLPPQFEPVYLDWIPPTTGESLKEYALRLGTSITTVEPFVLTGFSLGGMLAMEIAKCLRPQQLILISSIPAARELPPYFRLAGRLGLHRLVPVTLIKQAAIFKRLFTRESPEDKAYLRRAIRESDPRFIRWAMEAVLGWRNDEPVQYYTHIHGSCDEILPLRYTHPTHVIGGGRHLMVLSHSEAINDILATTL